MTFVARLKNSFQVRLFVALTIIVLIFIPGTGYFSYLHARKAVENQMQNYAIGTASQIAERIRQFLSQHMNSARLIKAFIETRMINPDMPKELMDYFYLLKGDHPEFVNIYYGNQRGDFTMVPPQSPEVYKTFDPRGRPWYKGAITAKGENWTHVYLFASTQNPGITASIPIYNKDLGIIEGVCGIDIDLSTFSKFLEGIKIENQGYAYVIENEYGCVIAHPDLAQRSWDPLHIELLSACLTDLKAAGKRAGLTAFHGEYFLTAYSDYPENDWTVGVTLPMTEFLSHIQSIEKATISLVLIGMLLCSMLSYLLMLAITRPLNGLQQGIRRLSSGDLDYHVDPPGLDFADALAYSYNQMAASLRLSQQELKRTNFELVEKEKMAALGQMTAGIAHELKNPLGVILGSAQVVANTERPMEMREEAARFIIHEIGRLDKTIKSFLAFSKPAPPDFTAVDLNQLLEETLAATEAQMVQRKITVEKNLTTESLRCQVDKDQIRQVFWNILINAVQAMPEGGCMQIASYYRMKEMCYDASEASCIPLGPMHQLVITFTDSGVGISDDQLQKIFDPFVSYRSGGIGLGLSIVMQVLKLHHADIAIDSGIDEGTTFTLIFPCVSHYEEKESQSAHR
jgi:signal transduction histidine kinase